MDLVGSGVVGVRVRIWRLLKALGPDFLANALTLTPRCPGLKSFVPSFRVQEKKLLHLRGRPRYLAASLDQGFPKFGGPLSGTVQTQPQLRKRKWGPSFANLMLHQIGN